MAAKVHRYTEEQLEYIRSIAEGRFIKEICDLFNEKFGLSVSERSVGGAMHRNGIKNSMQGATTRFQKGQEAWNKGTKGLYLGGESGWFKKGRIPHHRCEIGAEQHDGKGFIKVKVAQPEVWRLKHHVLYEQHKGEIPEGYKVIFADGNKRNFDLDNLILVSARDFVSAMKNKLLFEDTELTKTGITLAQLMLAVKDKENAPQQ